jgi:hypothetical protein
VPVSRVQGVVVENDPPVGAAGFLWAGHRRCSKPPVAEALAWVGIGLGQNRRRGGGRSFWARARLEVKAAGL